jgi:hypothetical protein
VTEQGDKLTRGPLKSRIGGINLTHFTDLFTDHAHPSGSWKYSSHYTHKIG